MGGHDEPLRAGERPAPRLVGQGVQGAQAVDRDGPGEGEGPRGHDPDAQPGEGAGSGAGHDRVDVGCGDAGLPQDLHDPGGHELPVRPRVEDAALGDHAGAVVQRHGDGGGGGVDGEQHARQSIAAPAGQPASLVTRAAATGRARPRTGARATPASATTVSATHTGSGPRARSQEKPTGPMMDATFQDSW